MNAKTAVLGILGLLLLAALGVVGVMIAQGVTAPAMIGLFLGVALGGLNLLLEGLSLSWALRKRPSAMMLVSLGGFGLRLVMVSVLTLVFGYVKAVSALTFALVYVASFLAFVVLQIWAVSRIQTQAAKPGSEPDLPQEREER